MEYIAAYHLHPNLKEKIMKDQEVAFNTFVHSPAYLFQYPNQKEMLFQAFEILNERKEQWPILKDMLLYPQIIESLLAFIQKLKLYQIHYDALPENSFINQEIKSITASLWKCVENPIELHDQHRVIPYFLDHASYHYSRSHHEHWELKNPENKKIELYYAQNKRQEVEAIIQDIILKKEEQVALIVPNKNEYLPLIESVLIRYGQDVTLQDRDHALFKHKLINMIRFVVQQDHFTFIKSLENNAFLLRYPSDYLKYLQHFEIDFNQLPEVLDFAEDQEQYIYRIQEKITEDHQKVYTFIQAIKKLSYQEKLVFVYDFYRHNTNHDLKFFKDFLIEYQNYLQVEYHIVTEYLLQKGQNEMIHHPQFQVFDYQNLPLEFSGTVYFLSLNAQNFPAIQEEKGLIDEYYLAQIPAYPSQNKRSEYMLKQKRWIYQLGARQVFSYVLANYEGKALEPAFEILDYAKKHGIDKKMWPLVERKNTEEREEKLSEDIAQNLWMDKGKLRASVSSLQKYTRDPLLYFKEYGLKVREEIEPSFNALVLGNLNHDVMENEDFEETWSHLMQSFPKESLWMTMIHQRYQDYLQHNQDYLQKARLSSLFETKEKEYRIEGNQIHPHIYIQGYIDRIDQFKDAFMIVDYKTSEQNLSWSSLQNASDLQLLTYAVMYAKESGLNAHAAAYYAFNLPNAIHDNAYHYTATRGLERDAVDPKKEWIKEKRYSAWYFSDPNEFYSDIRYWKGLRETKKGFSINHWNKYQFNGLYEFLQDRYERLYHLISSGELDIYKIEKELELDEEEEAKWKEVIQ